MNGKKKECSVCKGIGKVRVDREIQHPRFGRLEDCPGCGPTLIDKLHELSKPISKDKEEVPF